MWRTSIKYLIEKEIDEWPPSKIYSRYLDASRNGNVLLRRLTYTSVTADILFDDFSAAIG